MSKVVFIPPVEDCSYIDIEADMAIFINNAFTNKNVFRISRTLKEEELPLLTYDFKVKKWLTGRYIGKLYFQYNKVRYCFEVIPRFGNAAILHLLEEIFNIKLAHSFSTTTLNKTEQNELIKKLISFIWVKQLSKANIHGLPKSKIRNQHKGNTIKGRIDIRRSIVPLFSEKQIISHQIEKETNAVITNILIAAYQILVKHYFLKQNMLTESVKETIQSTSGLRITSVTANQYQSIQYGSMYTNFKSIVDFSWNIIQRKQNSILQEHASKEGDALFLDMAEIWEMYLTTIFKKRFSADGWKVYSQKFNIYDRQYYKRGIIPDIIIERENDIIVLDAKYKRMNNDRRDYDRSDFFQIHTYGSYYITKKKNLIGIGLLYPLKGNPTDAEIAKNFSSGLFGEEGSNTWFKVDGLALASDLESFNQNKINFLSRFSSLMFVQSN